MQTIRRTLKISHDINTESVGPEPKTEKNTFRFFQKIDVSKHINYFSILNILLCNDYTTLTPEKRVLEFEKIGDKNEKCP